MFTISGLGFLTYNTRKAGKLENKPPLKGFIYNYLARAERPLVGREIRMIGTMERSHQKSREESTGSLAPCDMQLSQTPRNHPNHQGWQAKQTM